MLSIPLNAKELNTDSLRFRIAKAVKIDQPPIIDGFIEPEIWSDALNIEGFFQTDPIEIGAVSEETSVQIIYDDDYIYVAFRCMDSHPEKIKKVLSRRDSWMNGFSSNSDWVSIGFDSRDNDIDANAFGVNAAGVKLDVAIEGNENYDLSWNSVWDAEVQIDSIGWSVEYKIPFSIFQFNNQPNMKWGVRFLRHIYREQETTEWPGVRKTDRGVARNYGILEGIEGISDPKQFEIIPYSLLGNNSGNAKYNFGTDLRYGISSNLIAQATFNPDFGQVESDPSVLNLTAFETKLEERRPFFSEGAKFFDNRVRLFNSRRIGKVPSYSVPENGDLSDFPDNTTILGAVKFLGNFNNGAKYGIINALASEEIATWKDTLQFSEPVDTIIEPQTNYLVTKFELPIINEVSRVGLMGTNVNRRNAIDATVVGLNWRLGFLENRLSSNGQVIQSNVDSQVGSAYRFNLIYTDPSFWGFRAWYGFLDDRLDINDLGYLRRNNMSWMGAKLVLRKDNPWGNFLSNNLDVRFSRNYRNDGTMLDNEIEIESNNLLKNYWSFGFSGMYSGSAYQDEDLFRDDRAWIYKTEPFMFFGPNIDTDRRKKVIFGFNGGVGYAKIRGHGYYFNANSIYKPKDNINIRVDLTRDLSPSIMQWVDIVETGNDIARVYAESKRWTTKLDLRIDWTLSPKISFQGFFQPFYAKMEYNDFNYLLAEKTMDLRSFDYGSDPGFILRNSIGTFVLRWEYSPGSTLFLVYNLNESANFENDLDSWDRSSSNALYFKISYWLKN